MWKKKKKTTLGFFLCCSKAKVASDNTNSQKGFIRAREERNEFRMGSEFNSSETKAEEFTEVSVKVLRHIRAY